MRTLLYILTLLFLLTGCQEGDTITPQPSALVVEGWIENDGFPMVILTKTFPITTDFQNPKNLEQYVIKWAKVTVSDGENSVVLTGRYDKTYFPPYVYTTSWLKGEVGKTYYLTVEYQDFYAQAKTTIPAPPVIDEYRVEKIAGSPNEQYQIIACFRDNPNEKNYYQFFTKIGLESNQYIASDLGSIDDSHIRESNEFPVYRSRTYDTENYISSFTKGEVVAVKFAQVDETSYHFWDAYTKSLSLNTNMFLSTTSSLPSNITGGKGYWCGYGAVNHYLIIGQ
jgi:hypothetical protein